MQRAAVAHPLVHRALELFTGAFTWFVMTAPLWGTLLMPAMWAFLYGAFTIYWLYKSLTLAVTGVVSYRRMRRDQARDWLSMCRAHPEWETVAHLVVFPTYREPLEILEDSLEHVAGQDFPKERVMVLLAFEERDPTALGKAQALVKRFQGRFAQIFVTFHPDRPDEVRGKASNLSYAVSRVYDEIVGVQGLDPRRIVLTVCDADSRLHPRYLSALTYRFLTRPNSELLLYQPAVLLHANIHRIPPFVRALDSLYSVVQVARLVTHHRLVTQSTYSLLLSTCHAVGYWDVDVIPEDSHMFFKVFFRFGERVRVQPIFLPVWADAAEGSWWWRTLVSHYRQARRWSWGASDIPYVVWQGLRARHVCPWHRAYRVVSYVAEHVLWPSHWFLLTGGLNLIPLVAPSLAASPLVQGAGTIASTALAACFPCLLTMIWVDWRLGTWGRFNLSTALTLLAWPLLPVTGLGLMVLPAVDAHTRLLLGRPLHYEVTEKLPGKRGARLVGAGQRAVARHRVA